MDWKHFFDLRVCKVESSGTHPYFHSPLSIPQSFSIEDLQLERFDSWNLTDSELKRLSLSLRKILASLHHFNSLEFERIAGNFREKLLSEKGDHLHFQTDGGGNYLFLHMLKHRPKELLKKTIICETSEIPLPVIKVPFQTELNLQFIYRPTTHAFFAGFPTLWAASEVLQLFDPKSFRIT